MFANKTVKEILELESELDMKNEKLRTAMLNFQEFTGCNRVTDLGTFPIKFSNSTNLNPYKSL